MILYRPDIHSVGPRCSVSALSRGANHPAVGLVGGALDAAERLHPRNELDSVVMAHQHVVGHVPDRRSAGIGMALDRDEQLMLGVRE